jgi:hypothetical protein
MQLMKKGRSREQDRHRLDDVFVSHAAGFKPDKDLKETEDEASITPTSSIAFVKSDRASAQTSCSV